MSDIVFADLDNLRASESPRVTIPYDEVVLTVRPDIVVLSRDGKLRIAELTICTNSPEGLKNAKLRKTSKENYLQLLENNERKGIKATYTTIEIGDRLLR